ncbi:MAG: hypothetical protein SFW62_04500 [Alphaproteobacteria bacterium]|nr:hypothetical protein [Alphaproteobacteria bacterium]
MSSPRRPNPRSQPPRYSPRIPQTPQFPELDSVDINSWDDLATAIETIQGSMASEVESIIRSLPHSKGHLRLAVRHGKAVGEDKLDNDSRTKLRRFYEYFALYFGARVASEQKIPFLQFDHPESQAIRTAYTAGERVCAVHNVFMVMFSKRSEPDDTDYQNLESEFRQIALFRGWADQEGHKYGFFCPTNVAILKLMGEEFSGIHDDVITRIIQIAKNYEVVTSASRSGRPSLKM